MSILKKCYNLITVFIFFGILFCNPDNL